MIKKEQNMIENLVMMLDALARDKEWLEKHRDIIKLECEYEYNGDEEED